MTPPRKTGLPALIGTCVAIFWPGAVAFGLPGVMAATWQEMFSTGRGEVGATMFVLLTALGFFMFLSGRWCNRWGAPRVMIAGALLATADMVFIAYVQGLWALYVWAFVNGVAQSLIYIPSISSVQQWFPSRRGLVSGVLNLCFAGSAGVMSPVMAWWLTEYGYGACMLIIGGGWLVCGVLGALPAALPVEAPPAPGGEAECAPDSLTPRQALGSRSFWMLWGSVAALGAGGIAMVTLSTTYGLSRGLSLSGAVIILTVFNVGSGGSRLIMGWLSDVIERTRVMRLAYWAAALAYLALPWAPGVWLPALLAGVVGFAFGTQWSVAAPLIADCFGPRRLGEIFGLIFTAYGFVSGALGPALGGVLLDLTGGDFTLVFTYLAGLCALAGFLVRGVVRAVGPAAA